MGKEGLLHAVRGSHPELEDRGMDEARPEDRPPTARTRSALGLVPSAWSHQASVPSGIRPNLLTAWRALPGESSHTTSLLISAAAWPCTMSQQDTVLTIVHLGSGPAVRGPHTRLLSSCKANACVPTLEMRK